MKDWEFDRSGQSLDPSPPSCPVCKPKEKEEEDDPTCILTEEEERTSARPHSLLISLEVKDSTFGAETGEKKKEDVRKKRSTGSKC